MVKKMEREIINKIILEDFIGKKKKNRKNVYLDMRDFVINYNYMY